MITSQTTVTKLARAIGLKAELFIKREDQNPFGSHKGRSIPLMIEKYADSSATKFVISSSGNAAIAAAKYIAKRPDLTLTVFVGNNIDETKRMEILRFAQDDSVSNTDARIEVKQVANPKQSAFQMEKNGEAKNLRQSNDDSALLGYEELARELSEIKNLSAIFIPTSSGTTAQGLYLGFQKLDINPQIHIVQTTACHPMVNKSKINDQRLKIDTDELDSPVLSRGNDSVEKSLASAIVDKIAHRKNKILEILKNTQGNGWVATNEKIQSAIDLAKQSENIDLSPNSALALVGLRQAIDSGCKFDGPIALLLTGK